MSIQIEIVVYLDDTKLKDKMIETQAKVDKTAENIKTNEKAATESFTEVMGYMRTTYLMISGFSRILGGKMSQVFSSMYMVGMSAIGTYKAIAAAIAATGPLGWVQAGIMTVSLITAGSSLVSVMAGQRELSTKIRGINMALHGISSMVSTYFL